MVKALNTKLRRDLWQMRSQVLTIALVIASGVAIFIASISAYQSLVASKQSYYAESRFADIFSSVTRAPKNVADRIAEIPGVAYVDARLVFNVIVDLPGVTVPTTGRLIGLPRDGFPQLNKLYLVAGRTLESGAFNEAVVSVGFAEANQLRPGSTFQALINGRLIEYVIVGVAVSPEYIYASAPGDPLPDDRRFGVFWVAGVGLAHAFNMEGAFNDVAIRLSVGASRVGVMEAVDRLLTRYGSLIAYERSRQTSDQFLNDEITQQRTMAATIPPVFLLVAAFLLNVVLGRLIANQREQIASLKALGYRDGEVARHYLGFVLIVVGLGVGLGIGLGVVFGQLMMLSYRSFFRFPELTYQFRLWGPFVAAAIAFVSGIAGTFGALRSVFMLRPAVAMRPPAPPHYRRLRLETMFAAHKLPTRWLIILRSIITHPVRALLTIAGIVLGAPMILMSLFWNDALNYMVDVQFAAIERSDAVLGFVDPLPRRVLGEVERMPGVVMAEPIRAVPVRIVSGLHSYRTSVTALEQGAKLRQFLDSDLKPVAVPQDGILLSGRLADRLAIKVGDDVELDVLEGNRPQLHARVVGFVDDLIGLSAYMDSRALARLMETDERVNAVAVRLDPAQQEAFYRTVKTTPKIASLGLRAMTINNFRQTTAAVVLLVAGIFTLFSITIAFGVVYNNIRVAFQERATELATLRIIGFTRAETARILFAEVGAELLIAVPIGLITGHFWIKLLLRVYETEMFRIPAVVAPGSYVWTTLIVAGAGIASMLIVGRRLWNLDLSSVLKARD